MLRLLFSSLGVLSMLVGGWLVLFPRVAQRKLIFSVPDEHWEKEEFFFWPFRKVLRDPGAFVFYAVALGMAIIFAGIMLLGIAWHTA